MSASACTRSMPGFLSKYNPTLFYIDMHGGKQDGSSLSSLAVGCQPVTTSTRTHDAGAVSKNDDEEVSAT